MHIRKVVGKEKKEHPLEKAFRLKKMVEELRGERLFTDENVRKSCWTDSTKEALGIKLFDTSSSNTPTST